MIIDFDSILVTKMYYSKSLDKFVCKRDMKVKNQLYRWTTNVINTKYNKYYN